MTNLRLLIAALALSIVGVATPSIEAQRIGFVDLQRALNETKEGQSAKRRLKRMFTKRQTELDKMTKRIKRMEEGLKKQKSVLSEDAYGKRVEAYRKAFIELQSTYVQHQRDLTERETKETGRILQRMQKILGEIGERDSYTAIVEVNEGGIFYFRKSLDLTNELIRLYDQRHPGGKGGGGGKRGGKAKGRSKKSGGGAKSGGGGAKGQPLL